MLDTRKKETSSKEGFQPNVQNDIRTPKATGLQKFAFMILCIMTLSIYFWAIWFGKSNWLAKMQEEANTKASGIEVQLKYRRDALVKLVDAAKSSIKFESSVLTDITKLRSAKSFKVGDKDTPALASKLDSVGSKINVAFENYPKLESVAVIRDLMSTADYAEREISASRRVYNATVNTFNTSIVQFPIIIVAEKKKCYNLPLFAASEEDKKDVSLAI
ncbi:MAG: hypothetical protein Ta2E_08010 [Mycoplasmoidaceae bacterium]|nr:MAG: hypothetical protein Ta2E_08010 [Mycoplasmoidaceae bacterium]